MFSLKKRKKKTKKKKPTFFSFRKFGLSNNIASRVIIFAISKTLSSVDVTNSGY